MAEFNTTNATATADDILNGKTAYVKGEKIKGAIQSKLGGAFTPTTEPQVICPAGVYTSSAYSVKGDANLKPVNIRKGVEIFGVEGTMQGNDIASGTLPDNMRTISLQPNDERLGEVFGGGAVTDGMTVTINATPYKNVSFYGWEENSNIVSESEDYQFTVTESKNLMALFSIAEHAPVPQEYIDVEYVQSGYPNIVTNIRPTSSTKIVMDVEPLQDGAVYNQTFLYSSYTHQYSNESNLFFAMAWSDDGVTASSCIVDIQSSPRYITVDSNSTARRMKLEMQNTTASVDGREKSIYYGSSSGAFGNSWSSSLSVLSLFSLPIKIYSCQIYQRNELVLNFSPCRKKDGTVGLYEFVEKKFYAFNETYNPKSGRDIKDIPYYKVSLSASPKVGGTTMGEVGIIEGGKQVDIDAKAAEGYEFIAWKENGQTVSDGAGYSFTVEENRNLVANFKPLPIYKISATVNPEGAGTVEGAGNYSKGKEVSLTAVAESMYKFLEWKENGEQVSASNPYTFIAENNRSLMAEFQDITILPDGYTKVEYIESPGSRWIDTGVRPYATTKIVMDVETLDAPSSSDKYFLSAGYNPSSGTKYYFSVIWNKSGVSGTMGSSSSTTPTYKTVNSDTTPRRMIVEIDCNNKTMSVDGSEASFSSNTANSSMTNIYLLRSFSSSASTYTLQAKIYSCQISNSLGMLRYLIPCINPEGVVGMFDSVEQNFYKSGSSSEFVAGPIISSKPTKKIVSVEVTDKSGLASLMNVSTLTVANQPIAESSSIIEIEGDVVEITFRLKNTISITREMSVNGAKIGHAGKAGDTISTELIITNGMTINIDFTPYSE